MEESEIEEWRRKLLEAFRARSNCNLVSSKVPPLTEVEETSQGGLAWTCPVVRRLRDDLSEEDCIEVLNRCAHVMPEERIAPRRELYQGTRDLEQVHRFCQEDFLE